MKKLFAKIPIAFTVHAVWYPILLALTLVMAQGLKAPITHTVFLFVLFLPVIPIIQLTAARFTLKVSFRVSDITPRKASPFIATAVIKNRSPFPFPLIRAALFLPDSYGEQNRSEQFIFSLLPFEAHSVDRTVEYAFRGEQHPGVECIYVYDLMRTVRLRIPVNSYADIFVMPRNLTLTSDTARQNGDQPVSLSGTPHGDSNTEPEDTRAYRHGDSLKSVHWKLSSKSEDLIVREYADESTGGALIICDLEPFGQASKACKAPIAVAERYARTADLYCTDLAVEILLAVIRRELEARSAVTLAFFENGEPIAVTVSDEAWLEHNFRRIASLTADGTSSQTAALAELCEGRAYTHITFITPILGEGQVFCLRKAVDSLHSSCSPEIMICTPRCMLAEGKGLSAEEQRIAELENDGFAVSVFKNT